ncbi:hypothetical protein C8F01DRAFT_1263427 [Mycena amicta]|nr:hypothetical protein C8F01DRAFT_1263427 [Mycena amicta]
MTLNLANFMARLETLELGCSTEIFHTAARAFPKHTFTISGGIVTSQTPRFPALRKLILGTVGLQGHWYEPSVFRLFENSPLLRSLTFGSTTLAFNHGRHLAAVVWPINEDVPWSQITELNVSGWVDFPTMLALLQACKNLGNLTLGQIIEKNQYRPLSDEAHHVLTALHTLTLSISHREAGDFVSFITTPALRHLTIISYGYKDQDTKVMELCQRSHFRLETLEIHGDYPLQSMLDLLKGNPNIWRLHLIEVCDQDVIGYLQNGKVVHEEDSPSAAATLLPHLRELSITLEHGKESRNGEKYLRRILRSQVRATSLEYAKVVVGRKTWEARGENIRVRAEEVEYNDS